MRSLWGGHYGSHKDVSNGSLKITACVWLTYTMRAPSFSTGQQQMEKRGRKEIVTYGEEEEEKNRRTSQSGSRFRLWRSAVILRAANDHTRLLHHPLLKALWVSAETPLNLRSPNTVTQLHHCRASRPECPSLTGDIFSSDYCRHDRAGSHTPVQCGDIYSWALSHKLNH